MASKEELESALRNTRSEALAAFGDDARDALMDTAEDRGATGPDTSYGAGVVDAVGAVGSAVPQAHDVAIRALAAPRHLDPGAAGLVNVTVRDQGLEDEPAIHVRLLADGALVGEADLALASHESTTLSFSYTAPATEGDVTLRAEADAVAGENATANNAREATVKVIQSLGTIRVAVVDSPGVDFSSYFSWRELEDKWYDHGRYVIDVDTTSLAHEGITLDEIRATDADVLAIPDACCGASFPSWRLTGDEVSAIGSYVMEGHGLWGSMATLSIDMPSNDALAPLFGLDGARSATRCNGFVGAVTFANASGTFAQGIGASYDSGLPCLTTGLTATTATVEASNGERPVLFSHKGDATGGGATSTGDVSAMPRSSTTTGTCAVASCACTRGAAASSASVSANEWKGRVMRAV